MRIPLEDRLRYALLALLVLAVFYGVYFAKIPPHGCRKEQ